MLCSSNVSLHYVEGGLKEVRVEAVGGAIAVPQTWARLVGVEVVKSVQIQGTC